MDKLRICSGVEIPMHELRFSTSRSRGPGGQNVNKLETRVSLIFDPGASVSLTMEQRARLRKSLANRLQRGGGLLRIDCDTQRTQSGNRREALLRFQKLLASALQTPKIRRPTRATRTAVERRLRQKALRSEIKKSRRLTHE
jgi:ribosome-associated protein